MERMEDIQRENTESLPVGGAGSDAHGVLTIINGLIAAFPGEMPTKFREDAVDFFTALLVYLHSVRWVELQMRTTTLFLCIP